MPRVNGKGQTDETEKEMAEPRALHSAGAWLYEPGHLLYWLMALVFLTLDLMDAVGIPREGRELLREPKCPTDQASVARALHCPCFFITMPFGTVSPGEFAPASQI